MDSAAGREREVRLVFAEYVCAATSVTPPPVDHYLRSLPDESSRDVFAELVDSYAWLQERLPYNLWPNVILAGRYRLIELLGEGGMGGVWRAEDEKLGREVAVKVMNLAGSAYLEAASSFQREIHLLAQLNHPGIVTVLGSGEDEDIRFLVMELVHGRSLESVLLRLAERAADAGGVAALHGDDLLSAIGVGLEPGHSPVVHRGESFCHTVARIMIEVLRTIEAAHARGVVHRDLKPANLMLRGGGHPVLLDFGLCGTVRDTPSETHRTLFGTPHFVAPEQLAHGYTGADPRTDVYQLGLVLYEFLTLQKCFAAEQIDELLACIGRGPRALRLAAPGMPRDLEDVCQKAIAVNPDRRYQSAAEFREDLSRYLRGEPVRASGGPGRKRGWRRIWFLTRRYCLLLVVIATGLSMGLTAGAVLEGRDS